MAQSEIIALWGNWRATLMPDQSHPSVEIMASTGEWMWTDCGYECPYCRQCLGCLRARVYGMESPLHPGQVDRPGDVRSFPPINTVVAVCPQSPTWLHDAREREEE